MTDAVSSRTRYRWYLHWEYGLLRERVRPDGGPGWRTEAWIDTAGPPLWHWIEEIAGCVASEISEHHAWSLIAEHGNGDLYGPDQSAQYDREVSGLDDRRDPEELPPIEPYNSMSEAGRERYVAARRAGFSYDAALVLGRGHFMLGPVPPVLMPDDDDADDR